MFIERSNHWTGMVASSILARGMEISFVPGEHGFFSFQVENVYRKFMCAAHYCIIKINKNKNNLRNHEFVRKKNDMAGES